MKNSFWMVCLGAGALALAAGCGDSVVEGADGGGGSGASAGSGGTGAGGTGGSGAGGTGGSTASCDAYLDEGDGSAVTIRFQNDSGLPIYLPASCGNVQLTITPVAGDDGVSYAYDPFCLQTCEDLQTEGMIDCAACEASSVLLAPGASYDVVWAGTGLSSADMPGECWAMPGSQGICPQQVVAAAGDYRIDAVGYESCGSGSCECDSDGLCVGDATGMEAYADSTVFTHVSDNLVEVVFGVCAFPCPSGS